MNVMLCEWDQENKNGPLSRILYTVNTLQEGGLRVEFGHMRRDISVRVDEVFLY
jgi:hypothetical protein